MKTKNALLKIGFFVLLLTALLLVNCTKDEITMENLTKGNGAIPEKAGMNLTKGEAILNLSNLFIEGYMINGEEMRPVQLNAVKAGGEVPGNPSPKDTECDYITVELRKATEPYDVAFTAERVMLSTSGTADAEFPSEAIGETYYIVIKGRNIIETWSVKPQYVYDVFHYDFHVSENAYGSNMKMVFGVPAIYSGDMDGINGKDFGDGVIDNVDFEVWLIDSNNFVEGYIRTDLNGDAVTDNVDFGFWLNNSNDFVEVIRP
jgi:hypothetical protein